MPHVMFMKCMLEFILHIYPIRNYSILYYIYFIIYKRWSQTFNATCIIFVLSLLKEFNLFSTCRYSKTWQSDAGNSCRKQAWRGLLKFLRLYRLPFPSEIFLIDWSCGSHMATSLDYMCDEQDPLTIGTWEEYPYTNFSDVASFFSFFLLKLSVHYFNTIRRAIQAVWPLNVWK